MRLGPQNAAVQDWQPVGRKSSADTQRRWGCLWSTRGMRDGWDWTAPMHAAEKGHATCVELLAERERDMKTTRRWCGFPPGTTALDVAEKMARTAIASILSG